MVSPRVRANQVFSVVDLYDECAKADPTPFYLMLNRISSQGRLQHLYTQNIDGLDAALPNLNSNSKEPLDPENPLKTVQLHGSILMMR
jgi:NAD-dependent histone deacetylase SIR2